MYKVIKDFRGSPDGCRVVDFEAGQEITIGTDLSLDLAEVALAEGWIEVKSVPKKKAAKKAKSK